MRPRGPRGLPAGIAEGGEPESGAALVSAAPRSNPALLAFVADDTQITQYLSEINVFEIEFVNF